MRVRPRGLWLKPLAKRLEIIGGCLPPVVHLMLTGSSRRRVLHFPEKSGIYHFLINFSSGMGEWYMKVVFEVLILFSLLSLISFT